MADTETAAPLDAGSPASAEASVASSPSSDVGSSTDSRAIAAQLLGDTEDAAPAPQAAEPEPSSQPPAAAISGDDTDPEYLKLLASGHMPADRHKAVLTTTRNKTRQQVEQEYREKYGWLERLQADQSRVENALGLLGALDGPNREQAYRTLGHALGISLTPPAPAEPEGPPPPDVKLADGSEFYSAPQLAKLHEWKDAQYEKKLQALEQRYQPLIHERHLGQLREIANAEAGTTLAECRASWPSFTALEGDIKQRMLADPQLSLDRAYIQAFAAKGLPALQQQHETDRASQLSRKAAASSAPPSAPRAVTPLRDRDRSTADIAREVVLAADL